MKNIKHLVTSFILTILFLTSCVNKEVTCEINVIDGFISLPRENKEQVIESLELTLEVKNNTEDNIFLEMASWTIKDKKNLLLLIECVNGDIEEIPLYYITRPVIYLDIKSVDTFTVRADFLDIRRTVQQCFNDKLTEQEILYKIIGDGKLIYRRDSSANVIKQKGIFYKSVVIE